MGFKSKMFMNVTKFFSSRHAICATALLLSLASVALATSSEADESKEPESKTKSEEPWVYVPSAGKTRVDAVRECIPSNNKRIPSTICSYLASDFSDRLS